MCEPLMPDVKRNCSYVSSADLPSDSLCNNLACMVGGYTENPEKPQNCHNWGGACSGQYGIILVELL